MVDEITFIDSLITNELKKLEAVDHHNEVSIESMTRVIAPFFVNVEKLLYLDADTIVHKDISNLFSIDMHDKCIGVCFQNDYTPIIIDKTINNYFNAGVILFDVKQVKAKIKYEDLISFVINNKNSFKWYDESIVNYIYNDHKYDIGRLYNTFALNRIVDFNQNTKLKNAKIIHYWGKIKPWNKKYFSFFQQKYFWKYGRKIFGMKYYFFLSLYNHLIYPFYFLKRVFTKVGAE